MWLRAGACLVLASCGFSVPAAGEGGDASGPRLCFDGLPTVCLTAVPAQPLVISADRTIDTDVSGMCTATAMNTAAGTCVVAASRIEIRAGAKVRVIGSKPLVLLGTAELIVEGTIDVASHVGERGAGANPATCVSPDAIASGGGGNCGGGGGGSFGAAGGAGGACTNGNGTFPGGAPSGEVAQLIELRGGCMGGLAARAYGGPGGMGGAGGGAVELLSASINIGGTVDASGEGGRNGDNGDAGGGGGGAGGMIVIAADEIAIGPAARVFAQGGGGGGGSSDSSPGVAGTEPQGPGVAAVGGACANPGNGGKGGDGGTADTGQAGQPSNGTGGGGGGGGAGAIRFIGGMTNSPNVVPPPR